MKPELSGFIFVYYFANIDDPIGDFFFAGKIIYPINRASTVGTSHANPASRCV